MSLPDPFSGLRRGAYACVAADPAWQFKHRSTKGEVRSPEAHYRTMPIKDICVLPVADLAATDAWLFLWTTGPHLPSALMVMGAWGFGYSGIAFTWAKQRRAHDPAQFAFLPTAEADFHVGMGYTTRKNCEFCLLGRRGKPKRLAADVRELIVAPVREHSRKPDEFFDRVERFCAGPRVELFARQSRPGWDSWGNERTKFDVVAA